MLSPTYDNPQSQKTLINWLEDEGFEDTSSIHSTLLAARGTKNNHNDYFFESSRFI